jgi:hypothetical protein
MDCTMLRSLPKLQRFIVWLLLAFVLAFGVAGAGFFVPAIPFKPYLISILQVASDVVLGWIFGLITFRSRLEIATSVMVIILAFSMRFIVLVFAIITTLFCGIDACGS